MKLDRRTLLNGLAALLVAPIVPGWIAISRRRGRSVAPHAIDLPTPQRDGVTFADGVVLSRRDGQITALDARCPHLGCTIGRVEGDELVCPCHGSRFDRDGRVIAGPAARNMKQLALRPGPTPGMSTVVFD